MSTDAAKARLDRTTPDDIHVTVRVAGRLPAFDARPRILAIEAARPVASRDTSAFTTAGLTVIDPWVAAAR